MTKKALLDSMRETFALHSDFPMILSPGYEEALCKAARRYGGGLVLEMWVDYQGEKPGKAARYFLEDLPQYVKAYRDKHLSPEQYFAKQGQVATRPELPDLEELQASRQEAGAFLGGLVEWLDAGRVLAKIGGTAQTILKQLGVGRGDG